jgi:hypothetical protein
MVKLISRAEKRKDWGRLTTKDVEDAGRKLCINSTAKSTTGKYIHEISVMTDFMGYHGLELMAARDFEKFVASMHLVGYAGRTIATYRSAWSWWYDRDELPFPTEHELRRVSRMIKGATYMAGEVPGVPRGCLDSGQLLQLRTYCVMADCGMYAEGFAVMWYGMFRHGAIQDLRVHEVRMDAMKGPLVFQERRKPCKGGSCGPAMLGHFKPLDNLETILRHLTEGRDGEELVFPGWDQATARAIIREAAAKYGWDTTVNWDGPHCMRYGAAAEARTLEDDVRPFMLRAAWLGSRTVRTYRCQTRMKMCQVVAIRRSLKK